MPRPSHRTFVSILMEQRQQAQHTAGRLKLSLVQTGSNMAESPSPPLAGNPCKYWPSPCDFTFILMHLQ